MNGLLNVLQDRVIPLVQIDKIRILNLGGFVSGQDELLNGLMDIVDGEDDSVWIASNGGLIHYNMETGRSRVFENNIREMCIRDRRIAM